MYNTEVRRADSEPHNLKQAGESASPAPIGSELRCDPALNHTVRRRYQSDPFEPVECHCQTCGAKWQENRLGEILPPNDKVSGGGDKH